LERLYRGDGRPRETVAAEGILPRSANPESTASLVPCDGPGADDWVATSKDPVVAAEFPLATRRYPDAETYVIRDPIGAVDKTGESGSSADERLVVVEDGVPAHKIEGRLIDRTDPGKGIIANPAFRSVEFDPVRPPREDTGRNNIYRGQD
ncbi:MAG: hypothetical protein HOQ36_03575, partial [Nocardia sp.]|nr:hypothetical protein [Nocardia sp.]